MTIAVDFDGVIHKYSKGWQDGSIYDEPVEGAIEALVKLIEAKHSVIIISTREVRQVFDWIQPKLYQFDIPTDMLNPDEKFWNQKGVLGITNRKIPASIYIDDRGLRFTNWGDILKYFI